MPRYSLIWRHGDVSFVSFPIVHKELLIGRASDCDIRIVQKSISRKHARIVPQRINIRVVDLDSRNGTFVNGQAVKDAEVLPGDELRIGRINLRLLEDALEPVDLMDETERSDDGNFDFSSRSILTTAQSRVLPHLIEGKAEKEIAALLHLSSHTVHHHVQGIYRAYGVTTRARLLSLLLRPAIPDEVP